VVETLATLRAGKWDSPEVVAGKRERLEGYVVRGYCTARCGSVESLGGQQTLFVNAAIQGLEEEEEGGGFQLPWVVEMELPRAVEEEGNRESAESEESETTEESGKSGESKGSVESEETLVSSIHCSGAKRKSPGFGDILERPAKKRG
jgi:hypothetical protein